MMFVHFGAKNVIKEIDSYTYKGEKTMKSTVFKLLTPGDEVTCQADKDPTLENGMVLRLNTAKTICLVFGEDPDLPEHRRGFLAWLKPSEIISVTNKCYRADPIDSTTSSVVVTGRGLRVNQHVDVT